MKNAGSRATKSRSAILIPSRDPQLRGRTRTKPSKMKSSLFPSVVVVVPITASHVSYSMANEEIQIICPCEAKANVV
jgi:hypothetical protein